MSVNEKQEDEKEVRPLSNRNLIDKNKYIIPIEDNNFFIKDYVIENNNINHLTCPICQNLLQNPRSCSSKKDSHTFCKNVLIII